MFVGQVVKFELELTSHSCALHHNLAGFSWLMILTLPPFHTHPNAETKVFFFTTLHSHIPAAFILATKTKKENTKRQRILLIKVTNL